MTIFRGDKPLYYVTGVELEFEFLLTLSLKNMRNACHCLLCNRICGLHARI